jgi:hypothetical protein
MSTLAASITSYFVQQTPNSEFTDLTARLERIERLLGQLMREQHHHLRSELANLDEAVRADGREIKEEAHPA